MSKRIALIGYGYWGPNILRNLFDSDCEVAYCCDKDELKLKLIQKKYPSVITTTNFQQLVDDKTVDAAIIATPTKTHFMLATKFIESGKDVLIEKPMVLTTKEANDIVRLGKKHKRIVMVDHTFLFSDAVTLMRKIIENRDIGNILYIDSVRTNLGLFQKDSNVIFDLAAHDFSIIQYLLKQSPLSIQAQAHSHVPNFTNKKNFIHFNKHEDVSYIYATYPNNVIAHLHVSWLSPVKIRKMLIVGTKKMIVYDDIEPTEKIKVYDKGVIIEKNDKETKELKIGYRSGDIWLPKVDVVEPLFSVIKEFISSIKSRKEPRSGGKFGAEITQILEGTTISARTGRKVVFKNVGK